jgi:FtsP/CotA-like multicopper oxidase with cupredoxin domain
MNRSLVLLLIVAACGPSKNETTREYPLTGKTVTYQLEISEFEWEVAPGAIYRAIGYNQTLPGPIIEAMAGDKIVIELTNKTTSPHSLHTHIVRYPETSDGAHKGVAPPGETITIEWDAVFAGTFPYHDHAGHNEREGMIAGLFGPLVIHAPDAPKAQVENLVVFADMDMGRYKGLPGMQIGNYPPTQGSFRGPHQYMHTINGKAYEEWAPRFSAKVGDRVRWRVLSLGAEFHTFHVHGHRWVDADGVLTDNINMGPGTYATFDWVEDNPGDWMYHCHVPEHMEGGMMGVYSVAP